ncbi:hypothetical protein N008_12135 [Hymenobacter sp. APR13]|nr:hypothetical protein N008_12135 [Hymenobacter sp. APR13]
MELGGGAVGLVDWNGGGPHGTIVRHAGRA